MARLILYLLIAIGAVATVPALRKRAEPPAAALWAHLDPVVKSFTDPIRASVTRKEEAALVDQLRSIHNAGQKLPDPDDFQKWINLTSTVSRDGWNNQYYLRMESDSSCWVGSNGPDGLRSTDDDILTKCTW